jgi:hypothetical protein
MGWLAHIHLPLADTSLQPFGCLVGLRLSLISVGWVAVSVAAGLGIEGQTVERAISPEPDPYLRLFVLVGNRQMAAAACFAVVFKLGLVVFRFIRAYQFKNCHIKGQLYCPFRKLQNISPGARKESFGAEKRNNIARAFMPTRPCRF